MKRREIFPALAALLGAATAHAQAWPSKQIKLISPFAAGGGSDFVARFLSTKLGPALGATVVVENKAGAGGVLGTDFVAKAPADGNTILISSNGPLALAPTLQPRTPYQTLRDLQPIAQLTRHPYILVGRPDVADFRSFLAQARAKPDHINYGTPGAGSAPHLAVEMLELQAGVKLTHIPYKNGAMALTDMLGGQLEMVATDLNTAMPLIQQGKVRALAVTTAKRSPLMPDVPTVAESGVAGYDVPGWFGVLVPAGTPAAVVERLHAEVAKAMASPEAREALSGLGGEVIATTPAQFSAHIRAEAQRWRELITKLNIKPDN